MPTIPGALLLATLLLTGCSDQSAEDPVIATLVAKDTILESMERAFMPASYWNKRVAGLERITEQAKESFQTRNQDYRLKLLSRREAILLAVQEARKQDKDPVQARNEAIQAHRHGLAISRDEAREAGRELRILLAQLRRAQDLRDQAK